MITELRRLCHHRQPIGVLRPGKVADGAQFLTPPRATFRMEIEDIQACLIVLDDVVLIVFVLCTRVRKDGDLRAIG